VAPIPEHLREIQVGPPGEAHVPDQRTPIRPLRVPGEFEGNSPTTADNDTIAPRVLGEVKDIPETTDASPTVDHMRVLVAEDDPVNSRIMKKRLEKLGHEVFLTTNGEECSSLYGEKSGYFDAVLMDMQVSLDYLLQILKSTH